MARRQINGSFLMTPYALLRMPEYGRFFDGASIGYLYRLITTGVRRQTPNELKFRNENGYVTKLAELYEEGYLASYFTTEELEEATGFTQRYLFDLLKKLEELRLIHTKDFNQGQIFIVGSRLTQSALNGYSVGAEHEGFFIDAWESAARQDPKNLAAWLVNNLAPPKQKEKFLGKIFPEGMKNISEPEGFEFMEKDSPEQQKLDFEENPRINKVSVNNKQEDSKFESTDLLSWDSEESDEVKEVKALIKSQPNWIEKFKAARKALSLDVPLSDVNALLARSLPEEYARFRQFPRLGYRLYSMNYSDKEARRRDYIKLSNLWSALHEDITGVDISESSDKFKEMRGFYKSTLLKKYSYNQVLWTLRTVVLANVNTLNFVASSPRNLLTVVEQHAQRYHAIQESVKNQAESDAEQEERLKRLKEVREMEGSEDEITNPWAKLFLNKESNE